MSKYLGDVSAYAYAVSQGYAGTEEEFAELMASYATVAQEAAASAESAAGSASAAASSKTAAKTSEDNAKDSETAAQTSEANAATSETNAAGSAAAAATSETNAAGAATSAAGSAQSAGTSAANAAASETNAGNSAANAATSETNAASSAQNAQQSAQSIAQSAAQIQINKDDITNLKEDITQLKDTKANIDGSYDDMSVGLANQLYSSQMTEDEVPYLFRTSGGSIDIGDREYDKIVGGTIAWNQLVQNGDFSENTGWYIGATGGWTIGDGKATFTAQPSTSTFYTLSQRVATITGHKYLVSATVSDFSGSASMCRLSLDPTMGNYPANIATITGDGRYERIVTASADKMAYGIKIQTGSNQAVTMSIDDMMVIDLTALYNTAVADYIYNLEQATSGAGIAWFNRQFPNLEAEYSYLSDPFDEDSPLITKKLRDYQAGILLSVEGLRSHDMVEFNAYDPATGTAKLVGGMEYEVTGAYTALTFEGETVTLVDGKFTPTKNGILTVTGGNDSTTCVHLVWSGWMNGIYEPYVKHSYPLDSTLTLRGIPKLDSNNNLYYDGDTYESDGTVTRRYGIVDLGTLPWLYHSETAHFYVTISTSKTTGANFLCSKYSYNGTAETSAMANKTTGLYRFSNIFRVKDTDYTDAATFKAAMSGVYLVYELATPTTETAQPYQSPQIVDDFGTEEYVTDSIVPVGHITEYPQNLRDKLQHLPSLADSDGYYLVQQVGKQMSLIAFHIPRATGLEDGTYTLKATVSNGTPTYIWVAESEGE
jgi:hypothetical protein